MKHDQPVPRAPALATETGARRPDDGRRRVLVLATRPSIDGGRYPVKRVVGDRLAVEADIIVDGHDTLRAVALFKHASSTTWGEAPLEPGPNDVWRASFALDQLGRYQVAIEAWVDDFTTWRRGLSRKVAAGVKVDVELVEGAALVEHAAKRARAGGGDATALETAAKGLRSTRPMAERIALALGDELAAEVHAWPDRALATRSEGALEVVVERPLARFSSWYELFPRSFGAGGRHGTLRDVEAHLDYVAELGFDVLYMPPIHPIGHAFRKGPDNSPEAKAGDPGSPWAIGAPEGGHTSIHPELGTLDDFDRLVAAARARNIDIALDIAFQASPDHPWVAEHPSWFRGRPDGTIQYAENPPKKYQDVYPFDFESADWEALWKGLLDVVMFWAARGVRVFRVDNPHTKPTAFWEWCIRSVQDVYPDVVFLAEAFTRPKVMLTLAKSGFAQSYTYFTWRTTRAELIEYMTELTKTEAVEFFRPNFWPTTPDIFPEHLHYGGRPAFVARLVLAATLSSNYGIYGPSYELMEHVPRPGSEELAQNEKYQLRAWDLDRADSLRHVMARLNKARRETPALQQTRSIRFHGSDNEMILCFSKRSDDGESVVLVVVNLDPRHRHTAWLDLDLDALGVEASATFQVHDLLGGDRLLWNGPRAYVDLDPQTLPAHVFAVRRSTRTENQFEYFL